MPPEATGSVTTFEIVRIDFAAGAVGESLYRLESSGTIVSPNRRDLLPSFPMWRAELLNNLEDDTSYSISPPDGGSFTWSMPLAFGTEIAVVREGDELVIRDTTGSEVSRMPSPIGERSVL